MERAAFPASSGTNDRLYTSLTHFYLELVIVHDKLLPAALARAGKKTAGSVTYLSRLNRHYDLPADYQLNVIHSNK
jgi:hypothetical protein